MCVVVVVVFFVCFFFLLGGGGGRCSRIRIKKKRSEMEQVSVMLACLIAPANTFFSESVHRQRCVVFLVR